MTTLMCPITEDRVLAACIVRPEIFEYLSDIEVDHFASIPHRVVWTTMRNLQADGEVISVLSICDAIEMRDLESGSHLAESVNAFWIGQLLCDTRNYTDEILFDHDVHWLRVLHARRGTL